MRVRTSRRQRSSVLAVVGGGLAVYLVFAIAFNWLMQPKAVANIEVAAHRLMPATVPIKEGPIFPSAPSELRSPLAATDPPVSEAVAAGTAEVEERPAPAGAKQAPTKHLERTTPRHERTGRDRRNSSHHASGPLYEFRPVW